MQLLFLEPSKTAVTLLVLLFNPFSPYAVGWPTQELEPLPVALGKDVWPQF